MTVSHEKREVPTVTANPGDSRIVRSGSFALTGRALQLLVAVFTGLLVPLCLDPSDVGVFFLIQALLAAGAIVAQLGLTLTIPTIVTEALARSDYGRAWSAAIRTLLLCAIAGIVVSAGSGILTLALDKFVGSAIASAIRSLLPFVMLLTPLLAFLAVLVELHRSIGAIGDASFLPVAPGLMLGLLILAALAFSVRLSLFDVLLVQLLAVASAVLAGLASLGRRTRNWNRSNERDVDVAYILGKSWPNLVTTFSLFLISTLDIWIVGLFGSVVEVAQYGLGLRLANLFLIPLATVNATIVPLIVSSWTRRRLRYLQWLLTLTATGATILTVLGYLGFMIAGGTAIRTIWGPIYEPAFTVAMILGLSQVIHTAGGSAGYILLLLGKQRLMMAITIALGIVTVAVAALAMIKWGSLGVALTYGGVNILQTAIFVYLSRRHYGLVTHAAIANPLRLLRTNTPII